MLPVYTYVQVAVAVTLRMQKIRITLTCVAAVCRVCHKVLQQCHKVLQQSAIAVACKAVALSHSFCQTRGTDDQPVDTCSHQQRQIPCSVLQ